MLIIERISDLTAGFMMLVAFVYFLRLVQAWLMHRTLRRAIDRDSALAPTLVERIGGGDIGALSVGSGNDDRTGLILIAAGLALAGFSLVVGDPEWLRYGLGGALFPLLVGAALLVRHYVQRRTGDLAAGA
ncbi:MAG: hypothetical protein QOJ94_2279 [Sphingomonadales bacterium]|jgi:hypothetical protein|nr:hypothetical protein [Sphingomonadales bacterium]